MERGGGRDQGRDVHHLDAGGKSWEVHQGDEARKARNDGLVAWLVS